MLRILGGVEPLPMEELGLCARDLAELKTMIVRGYGLILVCGPTGSGKTTTLHSVLHQINRPDIKIWTAEDPVEIAQAGLRQVQINARIDWTFAAAMRAFLRADPDVIMIGEMRDPETSKIAIEASLTGHLVFSTLHTNSAAESVVRLLDLGMDPFNFADALVGVLSQRLARKLCSKCKRSHPCSDLEIAELLDEYCTGTDLDRTALLSQWRKEFSSDGVLVLFEATGCEACRGGYKGRVGVYELLSGTADVKQLVRSRGTVPQVVAAAPGRRDALAAPGCHRTDPAWNPRSHLRTVGVELVCLAHADTGASPGFPRTPHPAGEPARGCPGITSYSSSPSESSFQRNPPAGSPSSFRCSLPSAWPQTPASPDKEMLAGPRLPLRPTEAHAQNLSWRAPLIEIG